MILFVSILNIRTDGG